MPSEQVEARSTMFEQRMPRRRRRGKGYGQEPSHVSFGTHGRDSMAAMAYKRLQGRDAMICHTDSCIV